MRLILAASVLVLAAVGAAHAAPRDASGFTKIDASAGTDVEVTVGAGFSVDVSGRDADRIVTTVSGDTLRVHPVRGWSWRGVRDARVRVTMPRVEGLSASSGADLTATGLNGGAVALSSSSGADLRVNGVCSSFTADASSGSDIHAATLRCETGSVEVSSGADAHVFASGRLDVDASSGGGVVAHGNPGIGNIELSSGGSLRRAD
ncbi:MAG: GIN domain-containing protein [Caulobacteraceae bacterium]